MKKITLLLILVAATLSANLVAQSFAPPFGGYSTKKITYLHMEDGSEIQGTIKSLKFKKGLIEEIKLKDDQGNKIKIDPEDIKYMYIPPSNLAKLSQKMDAISSLKNIQDGDVNQSYLEDGYLYMEKSQVKIKKKTGAYMMQLMNPTFSGKIKVFNDPFAGETASIGVGGMKLAGGLAKSYYIKKKGEPVAVQIRKKDYKKQFSELFGECPSLIKKYADDPSWSQFEKLIYEFSTECE